MGLSVAAWPLTCPPRPLIGGRLGNGRDNEALHARLGVVALLLAEPRVDDVLDAVDGERCLCNVGGQHALARPLGSGLKDLSLKIGRQVGIDRTDHQLRYFRAQPSQPVLQDLLCRLDFLLPCEEDLQTRNREVRKTS
jgi:hypothetical protein